MLEFGRKSALFIILFLCLYAFVQPTVDLQSQTFQTVTKFNSNPLGASILIDKQLVGLTPISFPLSPGHHDIQFTLPNHTVWQGDYVIYGSTFALYADFLNALPNYAQNLQTERDNRFINLSNRIGIENWSTVSNQMMFVSDEGEPNPQYRYLYDIDGQTMQTNPSFFGITDDAILRRGLGIASRNPADIFTAAYISPSQRYIMFFPHSGTNTFAIYDNQTKQVLQTDFKVDLNDNDAPNTESAFRPVWSTHESIAWMGQFSLTPNVIMIAGNQTRWVNLHDFKTQSGATVSMADGGMFTRPSDQGYAIIWGQNTDEPFIASHPWLVNLNTGIGVPIPLKNLGTPNDVLFSPDGTWIYAATTVGIQRIRVNDFSDIETITTDVSERFAQVISISYTLDYAVVSRSGLNTNTFLYKMPPH